MKPEKINKLCEALHHWLRYQILCGREALLSESYLNQPTGEYLLHAGKNSHLRTEYTHPVLNTLGKKGRPRQIDFCLLSKEKKLLTAAIELKWIAPRSLEKQRIIDDLLRLECIRPNQKGQHIYRYLIIAGRTSDLDERLLNAELKGNANGMKFTKGILCTTIGEALTVDYKSIDAAQTRFFDKFCESNNTSIPNKFLTTLEFKEDGNGLSVYCWRIQSSKNRTPMPKR